MDLYGFIKYGQILTIQTSLIIMVKVSKKDFSYEFFILYYITYWVQITNLEYESFCDVPIKWLIHIFQFQKSIITNKWDIYQ
jgi:hypothetical protein